MAGSQRLAPLLYASIGGLAAGLGTVVLVKAINGADRFFFNGVGGVLPFGRWDLILIVALGGLLAGVVSRYIGRESRGHGVPDVMFAFEHSGGRMPFRVTLSGLLATVATIGAGGSAGQEGPAVHIGSGLASLVGTALNLGQENRRLLIAVGAAGGISAVFNAPLTGSFFALEVVLRRFTVRNFSAVVLGAVLANVVYTALIGHDTALRSPAYSFDSGWQIFSYLLLGIGTAAVAVLFVRALDIVERLTAGAHIGVWAPALGGALVGALGIWQFAIIGTGTPQIASYLLGNHAGQLLLLLVGLKIVATSLTLGTGGTGGVFMPSLFLGSALGGAYGTLVHAFAPASFSGPTGAYAVAGMAGVFAAAAAAPITSLLLAFEVSQDYGLVVPLMTVVVISTAFSQLVMRETVYSEGLRRIGIDLNRDRTPDTLESVSVGSAYASAAAELRPGLTLPEVRETFDRTGAEILPVLDGRKVLGMIGSRELLASLDATAGGGPLTAGDIMTSPAVMARPEETVQTAAIRMDHAEVRAVAVVDAAGDFLGVLDRAQVLGAYSRGRGAAPDGEHRFLQEIRQPGGRFLRLRVRAGGPLAGKTIRDVAFPAGSLIVSVRRERQTLVPRSSMELQPGDQLVVIAEEDAAAELAVRGIGGAPAGARGRGIRFRDWYRDISARLH